VIVLDTHALLWLTDNPDRLGPKSQTITREAKTNGQLAISAASFWEIALLTSKRRLSLDRDISDFRQRMLDTGLLEIQMDGQIAIDAVALDLPHRDPSDRIIVATAIAQNATILSADRQILDWSHALSRQDATQ
jgi:PIN domain nuclease of toxin-antitoxin system